MDRRKTTVRVYRRTTINFVNFVFTAVVLLVAVNFATSSFTNHISNISKNIYRALDEVLVNKNANYTDFDDNSTYNSDTYFNPKGMAGLYNITTSFMNAILSKDVYPKGILYVEQGSIKFGSFGDQWQTILKHYAGLLTIVIILLAFAVFMPIVGLCFCCCRCCGKCGARSKPFDKKGDLCKKIVVASVLIGLGTLMLFGVVCAFVSNQHMQENTDELTRNLRTSVSDTKTYLISTRGQMDVLLSKNYQEFAKVLNDTLDGCSTIVLEQLAEYTNATSLTEVVNIVNELDSIKRNLSTMKNYTRDLRINANQLSDGLRKVQYDLLLALKECEQIPKCKELMNEYVNKMSTEIDYNRLPDISNELGQLESIIGENITGIINQGKLQFEQIGTEINKTISAELPKVKDTIVNAGKEIQNGAANVTSVIDDAIKEIDDKTIEPLNDMEKYIKDYSPYRYYVGWAVSSILLLITLCITLGLVCGVCGKRPDAYSDDCCNKGAGSRFLMIAVAIMFFFAIFLALITITYFITGLLGQRLICEPLRDPKDSQVIDLFEQVANFTELIGADNVSLTSVLADCHNNKSIYKVLNLRTQYDMDEVRKYWYKFNISETLGGLTDKINPSTSVDILSPEGKQALINLSQSGVDRIDFHKFTQELSENLTTVNLLSLVEQLDKLLDNDNLRPEAANSIRLSILHLNTYQTRLVDSMQRQSLELIAIAETLPESLKFGKGSFEEAIKGVIKELEEAEETLQINGTALIQTIASNFSSGIQNQVEGYLNRVADNVEIKVGQCGPLSVVINATLTATCDKLLLPWNGFWFSVFWCLLLFIPIIVFSVNLASLYQKHDSYPGPLVEANIGGKKAKKKNKTKNNHYEGRTYVEGSGDPQGVPRDVPGGSQYQGARYADMAPKHWEEFPAGGPPHYQRAPTEYERPPPYYYPGTEQQ